MTKDNLNWLIGWYVENCDGDWEHSYGIKIDTLDNPGWIITIDIEGTVMHNLENIPGCYIATNKNDWYEYKVEDGKFSASGDSHKLDYLIGLFRNIVENKFSVTAEKR